MKTCRFTAKFVKFVVAIDVAYKYLVGLFLLQCTLLKLNNRRENIFLFLVSSYRVFNGPFTQEKASFCLVALLYQDIFSLYRYELLIFT